jgi:hypothetical protein
VRYIFCKGPCKARSRKLTSQHFRDGERKKHNGKAGFYVMKFEFGKTGAERKALVAAVGEITGTKANYLGAPVMPSEPICEEYG